MDDTKTFKIQIKGTAYRFNPIDLDDIGRMSVVLALEPSQDVLLKAAFSPLKRAAVTEDWDALALRILGGEVGADDLVQTLKKLTERTVKAMKDAETPGDGE